MAERIIQIDSVDAYNKLYGWETLHPLVTVVNHANPMASDLNHSRLNYGLYALFLKQGDGCSIRYGREKYDYQEGTVVSFKPGQVVEVEWDESRPMPPSRGLLFHSDLLYGTQLARRINDYTFFDYDQREALHLSEREQRMVVELFDRIEEELQHPIDRHSQTLITDAIGLLLDYCMRYYDRQFITRHKVNSDILTAFHQQLREYFESGHPERNGLPTVAYFADKACLSPNYFGDLISKESGTTAQRHIQDAVIERSKQLLIETRLPVSEIACQLGFEYPQHFSRLFKLRTGMTPNEYRLTA
jgi:AraC-like DNA-binding protein